VAPRTFTGREDQASVYFQPDTEADRRRALMALVCCPTASIGTTEKHDASPAIAAFPDRIADDVFHAGFHSEASFGAASYFIARERGNVLVDSPRFTRPLVRRLEELGGVTVMFLTHRDDVADHRKFREHFRCERVMHERDLGPSTRDLERPLTGDDPLSLDSDLLAIPTPGHTRGSACLLYRDRFLFTGDHLAWSESLRHLYGFRSACWYDWGTLVRSTEKLTAYSFEWVLPGHGRRCRFPRGRMVREMRKALEWMRRKD
jgi:glyoxylase-like metal-dependent hydrolase (beta-lactamase superfamily II)